MARCGADTWSTPYRWPWPWGTLLAWAMVGMGLADQSVVAALAAFALPGSALHSGWRCHIAATRVRNSGRIAASLGGMMH